jgi:hypothetical protein
MMRQATLGGIIAAAGVSALSEVRAIESTLTKVHAKPGVLSPAERASRHQAVLA